MNEFVNQLGLATACLLALVLFAPLAQAQPCVVGGVGGIDPFLGAVWAFQTQTGEHGQASIGTFVGTPKNGVGFVDVIETISTNGSVTRLAQATGRYQLYPDCSGGTLDFMWNGQAIQFEFVFLPQRTEIYMVSTSNLPTAYTMWGTAKIGGVRQCPAGTVNPLDVLNNSQWAFKTFPGYYPNGGFDGPSIGTFKLTEALNRAGVLAGVLSLSETIKNFSSSPIRLSTDSGRYSVDPDCSTGTLYVNNSYRPVQFEFVFTNASFTEMYMLAIGATDVALAGHAKRF